MPRTITPHSRQLNRQRGVGMLEVLVSIVILSVGLLGMAGLQARALKGNQSSLQRSQAVMVSYSILDAIRVDRANALNYTLAKTCDIPSGGSLVTNTQNTWMTSLKKAFHGDVNYATDKTTCGAIACAASATSILCTITIEWDDSRAGGGTTETLQTSSII